jgi:ComF family protein
MLLAEASAARYAAAAHDAHGGSADLIVPVPLRPARLARRGHNQALTLAGPVARRLGIPLARHLAIRQRVGARQRGLSRRQRLRNPLGAFAIRRTWSEPGPRIAIVDDVVTTGATAAELARRLLAAGAREVHLLCATRTPRSGST